MNTCLPAADPRPEARGDALARAREAYRYRYDYHGIVALQELPLRDKDDVRWWAAVAEKGAALKVNDLARSAPLARLEGRAPATGFAAYDALYATLKLPEIAGCWQRDDVFAWQGVAGCNPYVIRRMTGRMDHFPVTDAVVRRATGQGLDALLAEGRLYVADYAALDGLPAGEIEGRLKVNFAPIALYASTASGLVPVAIQCGQQPGRLFTPSDGASWKMARTTVTTAEGNLQGIVSHFALCHQVMESVILSARRQLAPNHPLRVLLEPHFENTLITNDIAMTNLIGPGGYMERLQSPTLEASLGLANRAIAEFRLSASAPSIDYADRGVDDTDALPDYPARDDGLLVWEAMLPFVRDYVGLYYRSDADVGGDAELAGWVRELCAPDGGRLQGVSVPGAVSEVTALLAQILFRCTAWHASVNYASWPLFSYAPNLQTAAFGPGPTGGPSDGEQALAAMLPPPELAADAIDLFYEITVQLNRLGHYPERHFADPRVAPLLGAYARRLEDVEARILARDAGRLLTYPYQLPSRISQSIHV